MTDALRARLQASLGTAYTLERELGGGGMSRVFLAEETRFRRRVVIKVLAPELAEGLSAERFEREIALAGGLQHPHVVPVLSAGDVGGLPWYSMPLVEGDSLRARLARGPVPLGQALNILGAVTDDERRRRTGLAASLALLRGQRRSAHTSTACGASWRGSSGRRRGVRPWSRATAWTRMHV